MSIESENITWLRNELRKKNKNFRHTELGKALKEELTKLGYWKNKARGNPVKGGKNSRAKQGNKF